jgi:osmotically-inducible protein OsmY
MNKVLRLVCAASAGAAVMYFFDPDRGKRRRALVRDKAKHTLKMANETVDKTGRDLRNHAVGTFCRVQSLFRERVLTDAVLQERVRSKMGRVISHPKAVKVEATDGVVSLSGPIMASEEHPLLEAVIGIAGVKGIDNLLEVQAQVAAAPALQV